MGRKKAESAAPTLTASRATRLYKMLTLLAEGPQTRQKLLTRLRLDVRGFYRDLEAVRALGIEIAPNHDNKYTLAGDLDEALARLPFPDPGLSVRDALQLANGTTAAHRKLRRRIDAFLPSAGTKFAPPNKPR